MRCVGEGSKLLCSDVCVWCVSSLCWLTPPPTPPHPFTLQVIVGNAAGGGEGLPWGLGDGAGKSSMAPSAEIVAVAAAISPIFTAALPTHSQTPLLLLLLLLPPLPPLLREVVVGEPEVDVFRLKVIGTCVFIG